MSMPQQSQTKSQITWTNAPTRSVNISGTKFVYRQLGADNGVPVIFLNHLAAELDRWDPRVVDGIASRRRVIAFDNRGVGASEGSTPNSVAGMARDTVAFIRALGLEQVDLLGFSLGLYFAGDCARRAAACSEEEAYGIRTGWEGSSARFGDVASPCVFLRLTA